MKIIKKPFTGIFYQGNKIHLYFNSLLFSITAVITFQSSYYMDLIPRAILVYMLSTCSIYTGRYFVRKFLILNKWNHLIILTLFATTLYSTIGIFGMVYLLDYNESSDFSGFIVITPLLVILTMVSGGMIALTRTVFSQKINQAKLLQHKTEMELSLLSSRLSPHFLFNTLNNLYGLSIDEHQKVPGLLLKLSDLLSYALYSSNETFAKVQDELDYIDNFIALEKIRMDDRLVLKFSIDVPYARTIAIAPMILIVFIENAFKYAKNTRDRQVHIDIKIWDENGYLNLWVSNNCSDDSKKQAEENKHSKLGIATTIKRLNLLYPDQYSLQYGREKNYYDVKLQIRYESTD